MTLDEKIAEADRLGMSYGQFKAMLFEKNGHKPDPKEEKQNRENARYCEVCGIELPPEARRTTKTCGKACSYELNRIRNADYYRAHRGLTGSQTKKCKNCGKEFETRKHNQVYCSLQCQETRSRLATKGTRGIYGTAICAQCGNLYTKKSCVHKWCSKACKRKANRRSENAKQTMAE